MLNFKSERAASKPTARTSSALYVTPGVTVIWTSAGEPSGSSTDLGAGFGCGSTISTTEREAKPRGRIHPHGSVLRAWLDTFDPTGKRMTGSLIGSKPPTDEGRQRVP